jgi:hypothetical protein
MTVTDDAPRKIHFCYIGYMSVSFGEKEKRGIKVNEVEERKKEQTK